MPIYCDESGGVGRGVMTLAALNIDEDIAEAILQRFRDSTGLRGELKGSRIDLAERAFVIEMLARSGAQAAITVALSATQTEKGEDRGNHDIAVYASLVDDAVGSLLAGSPACSSVVMDTGRYSDAVLEKIRRDVADMVGPWNVSQLEDSDRLAGLQLADVIANSFYNRARVSGKQARVAAILQPQIESGQFAMRILDGDDIDPFEKPPVQAE